MAISMEQAVSALLAKGFLLEAQGGVIRLHNDSDLSLLFEAGKGTVRVYSCLPFPKGIAPAGVPMELWQDYKLEQCSIDANGDIALPEPIAYGIE